MANGEQKSLNPVKSRVPFVMSTVVVESTDFFHVNKLQNGTNECADNFSFGTYSVTEFLSCVMV